MTLADQIAPETPKPKSSRRRDWILLPALSLLTICAMAGAAELLSRWLFPATQVGFQNCFSTDNPNGDGDVKPNSVCWERTPESSYQIEYRFNQKGHRAGAELTPKQPGVYRIVLIGSSFTQGLFVPREKTFAALLPEKLSTETGRTVEVYNEATGGKFRGGPFPTRRSAQHFDEVLTAQPDMILWVITPDDVLNAGSGEEVAPQTVPQGETSSARPRGLLAKLTSSIANGTVGARLRSRWEDTRTSMVLKHLLIASESQDEYIHSYLQNGGDANSLKTQPDGEWRKQMQYFDQELAQITGLAKDAGIPLVAVFAPNRAQAAMISRGDWPAGYDPFQLESVIRTSLLHHGAQFIDILPDYRGIPSPEQGYMPVDGHPNTDGQALISRLLAKELTNGSVPELKALTPRNIAMEPGR
jgi:hypothetical protein